eukprot:7040915-Prymnesium_polylepis.1
MGDEGHPSPDGSLQSKSDGSPARRSLRIRHRSSSGADASAVRESATAQGPGAAEATEEEGEEE